jgi:uroporphyrin-III C-methyltransferase/precorrin-2 dehydrogenase/sirohydrochlorin ferrochelatase
MRHFPTFFDLKDRNVLVVGGTSQAAQRVELLLSAGARISVIARTLEPALAEHVMEGRVAWSSASFKADDLIGMTLVFVASGDGTLDQLVADAARVVRVPVNVVDQPDHCDFIMPAIVDRGAVTIGISTGGSSPVLARSLRARIEAALPARLGDLARFAGSFRSAVSSVIDTVQGRRRFWERVIDGPIGEQVLAGHDDVARKQMLATLNGEQPRSDRAGAVYIVGAGPGDPDLLTLRALRLMQQADVVLYDELVGREVLDYVRRDALRIYVGKSKANHSKSQEAINALLVEHAKAGKRVLRLKGGDPFVFGRGGEELEAVRRNGIEAIVVPGITAALGCAAAAGIPLTHRDHASSVTFVTGHSRNGEPVADWQALARADHTIVVYMGLSSAGMVASRLTNAGLDTATPVAVIERGTRPDQHVSVGTLADLPKLALRHGGPALIVIGKVAALAQANQPADQHIELQEAV